MNLTIVYDPHKKQGVFHRHSAKFKAFVAGVGSGKTVAGTMKAIEYMNNNPKSFGMVVAPTYRMLADSTQRTFFELLPPELILEWKRGENLLKITNGSEVIFRSADEPDKLRGPNLNWFWIDEASRCSHNAWRVLIGRLRRGNDLKAWITTTPKGFDWVYEEFGNPLNRKENHFLVTCSARENRHLPPEFIKDLEAHYSGAFAKQEIEGEFVGFEGVVYPVFSRQAHVLQTMPFAKKKLPAYVGVDFGFTNPSAMLLVTIDSDNRLYVWKEFYQRGVLIEELIKQIKAWKAEGFDIQSIFCDPSEPQFIHQFRSADLPAREAPNEVMPGIQEVTAKLSVKGDGKPSLFVSEENCPNLVMEFLNYRYPEGKDGKSLQENPVKIFDHLMDALRYVCFGLKQRGRTVHVEIGY